MASPCPVKSHRRRRAPSENGFDNAQAPEGVYYGLMSLNGKLYAVASKHRSEGFIIEVDPTSSSVCDVVKGRSDTFAARARTAAAE